MSSEESQDPLGFRPVVSGRTWESERASHRGTCGLGARWFSPTTGASPQRNLPSARQALELPHVCSGWYEPSREGEETEREAESR